MFFPLRINFILTIFIGIVCFFTFNLYQKQSNPFLQLAVFDVGQGNSTLFITPLKQTILIDAGPLQSNLLQNLSQFLDFFHKDIDVFILTHPDQDHYGGLFELLKYYKIKLFVLPASFKNTPEFFILWQKIQKDQIPYLWANASSDLKIGQDIALDFLYPQQNFPFVLTKQLSNFSLMVKLNYQQNSFFFSGDGEQKEEKMALLSGENFSANFYQVGHHGSRFSSSLIFLQALRPQISIISSGKNNSYGHPHQETLQRLKQSQIVFYNTADFGNLFFQSDGIQTHFVDQRTSEKLLIY